MDRVAEMTSKRVLDVCVAALGLLVSLPLLLLVAIAVRLDSPGPALFTQLRVGRRGRLFKLYKFRSMIARSEDGPPITGAEDRRITRIGRVIRPLRIDELPQLFNVVKGDMSLVGPRPEDPSVVERYTTAQREVLEARPGITGPTQLAWLEESASLPVGSDPTEYYVKHILPRKLEMDLRYVRSHTLLGDIRALLATPLRLARLASMRLVPPPLLSRIPKILRLLADFAGVAAATYLAFLARFDGDIPPFYVWTLLLGIPFELSAYAFAFLYLRTYRGIWRYTGVPDFWHIAKACAIGGTLSATVMHMAAVPYPRSSLLLAPVFALVLLSGMRLTWRSVATALAGRRRATARHRVVIVGAGRTGASIVRDLLNAPGVAYQVVGFVDDAPRLRGSRLHNLPVLGTTDELPRLAQQYGLSEAIIAIPRPALSDLRRIRDACTSAGLVFKTLPSLDQLVHGDGEVRYLRKVDAGKLLEREAASLQAEQLAAFLEGKRVMVTGAGGSIGSELCRQIVRLNVDSLLMVERAENPLFAMCAELRTLGSPVKLTAALADIKHILRMSELLTHFRPQVVFHTAAYKHVPMLESHPTEAVLNNVIATARLANLASAHGVETFVFISTDKAVRPNNLMGATKRICELYLMALDDSIRERNDTNVRTKFRIVRFGNVLGSAGSALPLFQHQVESGGPITITDPEVSRFFMTIQEAVGLVLESATLDVESGIAVLDMGDPIKITKLADDFVTALGLPPSAVPREIIGLRPGEKLHEVLWDDLDEVLRSTHPRILVVRPRRRPLKEMDGLVRQLEQLAVEGQVGALLEKVREAIPSYTGGAEAAGSSFLEIGAEPRKPLAISNGRPTPAPVHRVMTRPV